MQVVRIARGRHLQVKLSQCGLLCPNAPQPRPDSQPKRPRSMHTSSPEPAAPSAKLAGRVAVITGGASGIGASCARAFVEHGARVFVADVEDEAGRALCEELGPSANFFHCDVLNEKDIAGVIDQAVKQYGKLDILHNNVGVGGRTTSIQDVDIDDFDKIYATNVRSVVLGLKYAARVMIPRESGSIISTSSVAAVVGGSAPSPYAFTKSAIPGITRQAAAELGKYGIRVNCISPLAIASHAQLRRVQKLQGCENLTLDQYSAMMDEISELKGAKLRAEVFARTALFLASDDASYTTGQNFVLDGGFTCSKPYPLKVLNRAFDNCFSYSKSASHDPQNNP
ncbi:hypothetical protein MPTK1_5g02670 [Marchantia polymorpha subsp. ruderalis]|uniref:Uncharacterized protein n=2 Tax=Marchantia polymorpha TaxID=3197 RepID=A0AAF6BE94_MARPO|nr:hypothetical protein MARPO_0124s0056 [Marchantia polymorpha]BBN10328.1 hypothetical protein Mp_5g02670 [Marchantia polymorpha subsp. ruderalis]|eukprot:PTQ30490.1 hypothetical protein MARPO_0124s0056 [Marchantia polymorpha]